MYTYIKTVKGLSNFTKFKEELIEAFASMKMSDSLAGDKATWDQVTGKLRVFFKVEPSSAQRIVLEKFIAVFDEKDKTQYLVPYPEGYVVDPENKDFCIERIFHKPFRTGAILEMRMLVNLAKAWMIYIDYVNGGNDITGLDIIQAQWFFKNKTFAIQRGEFRQVNLNTYLFSPIDLERMLI